MLLDEFVPFNEQAGALELLHLFADPCHRNEWVERSMGHQNWFLHSCGRQFFQQHLRVGNVPADSDNPPETLWISQTSIQRHQATLRKSTQHGFRRGKSLLRLSFEHLEKHSSATTNPRVNIAGEIVP